MFSIATVITYQLPHFLVIILYLNMFWRKEVNVVWPGNLFCYFFIFLLTLKLVTSVIIIILNLVNNNNYRQLVILGYWMNIVHKMPQKSQNNFFQTDICVQGHRGVQDRKMHKTWSLPFRSCQCVERMVSTLRRWWQSTDRRQGSLKV